ncbi:hypothetical protein B7R21_19565 [Subtercola boreus]|uniref:DUF4265 domain-containing protein n=1 Tax=Subtercola boreus TaxID=120213 RepID=A0A3E0VA40_9MICO|nr:DUF4265 domain-containing protein [Subtercola boreus]RFA06569.1 hypothetical protein B7R21_19565 [Subtercola boreus]
MDSYKQHPSLVATWNGEDLDPLPESAESTLTVWLPLPPDDGPQTWEGMNAVPVEDGIVELRAVPAYTYGVNFGDHLSTLESAEGPLVCTGIVRKSGQATFRICLPEARTEPWRTVAVRYAQTGCLVDVISERLIALSCSDTAAPAISQSLASDEKAGAFVYENG